MGWKNLIIVAAGVVERFSRGKEPEDVERRWPTRPLLLLLLVYVLLLR